VLCNQGVSTPASVVIIYRCSDYTVLNKVNINKTNYKSKEIKRLY